MENPNSTFHEIFAWFVTKCSHTSADNCKSNRTTMALECHLTQGFKLLVTRQFQGATFAKLPKHPIPDDDIVDIGICVIHRTGLFAKNTRLIHLR